MSDYSDVKRKCSAESRIINKCRGDLFTFQGEYHT